MAELTPEQIEDLKKAAAAEAAVERAAEETVRSLNEFNERGGMG